MTRRILVAEKGGKNLPAKIRELIRHGGGMKHRLMSARLELIHNPPQPKPRESFMERRQRELRQRQAVETETRHCPHCGMHVSAEEAAWCMICPPFPELEESGQATTHTTTAKPGWWKL